MITMPLAGKGMAVFSFGLVLAVAPFHRPVAAPVGGPVTLQLKEFVADSESFDVNSTLITGPTEAILVDAQYKMSGAAAVADMIAASGKHLKAVFITHPDDDHYYGLQKIVERFPGTPVYMSAAALDQYQSREMPHFAQMKERMRNPPPGRQIPPAMLKEFPDSLILPQLPPSGGLSVDGVEIRIVADRQGDVLVPANSYLWIPSQRIVIAGDIVFNGVNVWLAASSTASRVAWRKTIQEISDLHPLVVVAGHKRSADLPDSPDVLKATATYLSDFDAAKQAASAPDSIVAVMRRKHPDLAVQGILWYAAKQAQ